MTGTARSRSQANFAERYDHLARAWARHESLRRSGSPIHELSHSSLELSQARSAMRDWWANHQNHTLR